MDPGIDTGAVVAGTGIIGTVMSVVGTVFWARRKFSSDNKGIAEDKAETAFSERMTKRLDQLQTELEAMTKERNALAGEVGGLRSDVAHYTKEEGRMRKRIASLERKLGITSDTDHLPL